MTEYLKLEGTHEDQQIQLSTGLPKTKLMGSIKLGDGVNSTSKASNQNHKQYP